MKKLIAELSLDKVMLQDVLAKNSEAVSGWRTDMLLILSVRVNAFVLDFLAYQSVAKWENDPVASVSGRVVGLLSILLWFAIVAAGRRIAYV